MSRVSGRGVTPAEIRRTTWYVDAVTGDDQDFQARVAARRNWPIRVYRLGEEPEDDLSATTTPEERLAILWELSLDAWPLAGHPLPEYSRAETPSRVIRCGIRSASDGKD